MMHLPRRRKTAPCVGDAHAITISVGLGADGEPVGKVSICEDGFLFDGEDGEQAIRALGIAAIVGYRQRHNINLQRDDVPVGKFRIASA